jgi:hypothetical protein
MHRLELLSILLVAAGCAATDPAPAQSVSPVLNVSCDALDAALARAKAEQRDVLVLIAPAVRCCAEPGRVLTPALDVWRKDAHLQSL